MIRPGLAFALWLAIGVLVVVNDIVGDTWIAVALSGRAVEWYKVLVPLPYVALLALIHARRTQGPHWLHAAMIAAINWPPSIMLVDYLYGHFTFGEDIVAFFQRLQVQYGQPYALLIVSLFAAPLIAGRALAQR